MKQTSLYEIHRAAGATMVPFAGWEMPVSYAGTVSEVAAVRSMAGLFDVSHMGEVTVTGTDAFVQDVTTNDAAKLSSGKAQYSLLLNEGGGVVDDIIVYCRGENDFLIVLNAGCKDKDLAWLKSQADGRPDVTLVDISEDTALIALQGPQAVEITANLLQEPGITTLKRFHFAPRELSGCPVTLSRTGYTGEDGFEIFCAWQDAPLLWNLLTDAGAISAGLGARDVLRLEAAYSLYGHELDTDSSPYESGVGWAVKMGKGSFVGHEALLSRVPQKSIVGLRMDARAIPRENYFVFSSEGMQVGQTTSGTWSPTIKAGIALARLESRFAEIGTQVSVDIRGRLVSATIVHLPFYRNGV